MGIIPIIQDQAIAVQRHLQILPQIFNDLPEDLINTVEKCKTNADIKQVGMEMNSTIIKLKQPGSRFTLLFYGKIRKYSTNSEQGFKI
jgi:hypothetical protein